ncbi:MAG: class I SAM-dependent methyltransferase [Armatimonadota bacterium]
MSTARPAKPKTRLLAALAGVGALLALGLAGVGGSPHRDPLWPPRARVASPLFDPARAHALLDDPMRDGWQLPDRIAAALELAPGATVADLGAGSGYLLPHLSRAVGPTGTVLAEEIQPEYLPALRKHAERLGNVRVVLGTADDPRLPEGSVDCFTLLTVYHEVERPVPFLKALRRAARPGARLAIVDFDAGRDGYPPAPPGHEIAERDVLIEARAAGWELERRHELFTSQFFLVFKMKDERREMREERPGALAWQVGG